jgi:chromosome segregation protein
MLGVTMEESGVSKIITIKLDTDASSGSAYSIPEPDTFEDEEVEPEQNIYVPPHPAKRMISRDRTV